MSKKDEDYDYWGNLNMDFGFTYNEMAGINRAVAQHTKQSLEALLRDLADHGEIHHSVLDYRLEQLDEQFTEVAEEGSQND